MYSSVGCLLAMCGVGMAYFYTCVANILVTTYADEALCGATQKPAFACVYIHTKFVLSGVFLSTIGGKSSSPMHRLPSVSWFRYFMYGGGWFATHRDSSVIYDHAAASRWSLEPGTHAKRVEMVQMEGSEVEGKTKSGQLLRWRLTLYDINKYGFEK